MQTTLALLHAELSLLGKDAELAYSGEGWTARVSIRQKGKRRDTRVSEWSDTPAMAKAACVHSVHVYRKLWGEDCPEQYDIEDLPSLGPITFTERGEENQYFTIARTGAEGFYKY